MTADAPFFTVIIPSRNRAHYLERTLRTCMLQEYERLEVVVTDDASTEDNEGVVAEATRRDPRIRFVRNKRPGMRDNFELALTQARPGFVIALGGDDGLLPHGIQGMADTLRDTRTEMLAWPAPVFTYPGVRGPSGQLQLYRRRGVRVLRTRDFLERQARRLHYLSDVESPMFYVKGVVSTRLVEAVRRRSPEGRFYTCSTPDGFSGIVLAGETDRYAFSGEPFSIYGVSPDSQGKAYLGGDTQSRELSTRFFQTAASLPMHRELASQPYSPLITLMTADFLLTARDLPGWGGSFPPLDFRQLLAQSLEELANGLYHQDRVLRELQILHAIAAQHGLRDWFVARVADARRHKPREHFAGTGITRNSVLLDGAEFGLRDIVDAAYTARALHHVLPRLSPATIARTVARSVGYGVKKGQRGDPFPPADAWAVPLPGPPAGT